ncbi:hypothetical protein [Ramlibacter albus]|uniref:Uncharacterized protein n=1 Tax=Ramlibacter albus TaxID=2079448 RepID=A0A923M9N7_9BURK|nr:hypothetical protein [Ramlibacter albus]MBC5765925.1 hypothetical protein [Ramlibacter albus]
MMYLKSDAGRHEVQARSLALTPAQRQVLILCDGERYYEDLVEMMPAATLRPALEYLCEQGLLQPKDIARPVKEEPVPLDEASRFRAMVELATSMAVDLGFVARIQAQLAIEKAQNPQDLTGVVALLYRNLAEHGKKTPLLALRLNKLRQLAQMQPA